MKLTLSSWLIYVVGKCCVSSIFIQTMNSDGYFELSAMNMSPNTSTLTRGVIPEMHRIMILTISSPLRRTAFVMFKLLRDSLTKVARNDADFFKAPVSGNVMPFTAILDERKKIHP